MQGAPSPLGYLSQSGATFKKQSSISPAARKYIESIPAGDMSRESNMSVAPSSATSAVPPKTPATASTGTGSIGSYQGTAINPGTQEYINQQVADINNRGTAGTSTLSPTQTTSQPQNTAYSNAINAYIQSLMPQGDTGSPYASLLKGASQSQQDYAKRIADLGQLGAGAVAGNLTTGTQVVGQGNAAIASQSASQRMQALSDAQKASLKGTEFEAGIIADQEARDLARKTSTSDALKARAEFEGGLLEQEQGQLQEVGGNLIRIKPDGSYETVYEGGEEPFSLSEGQSRYIYNSETGQYEQVANVPKSSSGSGGYGGFSGTLSPLAQAVQNGTISIDKIPIADRARVAAELATSGIESGRQQTLTSNLDVVQSLIDNPNKNKISGYIQGALGLGNIDPRAQLALNQYNQLRGILSLENREKLKGSGAISDFEFKVLSDAATALGRNLSDTQFNEQLQKIKEVFEGRYAYTRATSPDQLSSVPTSLGEGNSDPLGLFK